MIDLADRYRDALSEIVLLQMEVGRLRSGTLDASLERSMEALRLQGWKSQRDWRGS